MRTMKAAVLETHGVLKLTEIAQPVPLSGEVLVRIKASGVNPLDLKIKAGQAAHARHPLPAVLGIDLAGVVEAVGPGVTAFHVGDEVYGMTGGVGGVPGSLAEYAAVDARLLAPKPANLSMVEAAALPLVFITAWEGLVDRVKLEAGKTVLVLGGAGGVGHMAIQIAVARGARVFATDSAAKTEPTTSRSWRGCAPSPKRAAVRPPNSPSRGSLPSSPPSYRWLARGRERSSTTLWPPSTSR